MPSLHLVWGQFMRRHGHLWTSPAYPTKDKVIPFMMFLALSDLEEHLTAQDAWHAGHGTLIGYQSATRGDDPGVRAMRRAVEAQAFPMIRIPKPKPTPESE